jgi:sec-independent protein translocase protein TatC
MGEPDNRQMTFGQHLDELRRRLWYAVVGVAAATGLTMYFGDAIMNFLMAPIKQALLDARQEPVMIATSALDPFMVYMKVTLLAALFISSPWVAYQLWRFVAAGLFPRERRYVYIFGPATALLFIAGTAFSYYVLVRYGLQFLVAFGAGMKLDMEVRMLLHIDTQLMFVVMFSLVMGLVFELPLVMLALSKIRIFTSKMYASKRRIFIVGALIVAAIITPTTDPVNLILATAPILVLYELGIWTCRISERRRDRRMAG